MDNRTTKSVRVCVNVQQKVHCCFYWTFQMQWICSFFSFIASSSFFFLFDEFMLDPPASDYGHIKREWRKERKEERKKEKKRIELEKKMTRETVLMLLNVW